MPADIFTFRKCLPGDIAPVIAFCNANGFTPRTEEDWIGGGIEAVLAFDGNKLVGAVPFYKRQVLTNSGSTVTCGHFTAVAVDQDYRSAGIGSTMLSTLYGSFDVAGMFVNSNEDDRAYRWYTRNGYDILNNIIIFKADSETLAGTSSTYFINEVTGARLSNDVCANIKNVFDDYVAGAGGFESRDLDFWNQKLRHHYYSSYNRYFLLTDSVKEFASYGFAVINAYPGRPKSVDILELAFRSGGQVRDIMQAAAKLAVSDNITPVRIALEEGSSMCSPLLADGFTEDWSFSMLYHSITCSPGRFEPYKYFHFDYA